MPPDIALADQIAALDDATARLSAAVQSARNVGADAFRRPSRLPDWTIGHVVTHLARNADAQRNLLHWAESGEATPAYASPEARAADIETGANRDTDDVAEDFAASVVRLDDAIAAMAPSAWSATVDTGRGGPTTADVVLAQRLAEVEIHHHDLGVDDGLALLSDEQAAALLAAVLRSYVRTRPVPGLTLRPQERDAIELGSGGQEIAGPVVDIAAWLAGRGDGARLTSDRPLPELPAW